MAVGDFTLDGKAYLLARKDQMQRGARRWQEQAVGASIAQQTPSETRYGNQSPMIESPMVFGTTYRGYGDAQVMSEGRYHYSVNVDARFPDAVLPGPLVTTLSVNGSANVNGFFEQNSMLFALAGRYVKAISGADVVTTAKDFGSGKAATDCGLYNGKAYVGMGYTEAFWERSSNANPTLGWTQATGLYMGQIAPFRDRLYASVTADSVKSVAASPTVAVNWTAAYSAGDPTQEITALAELGEILYIGKPNGLYALDADGLADMLTPELAPIVSAYNCENMAAWHGVLWVPHIRGLLAYQNLGGNGFRVTPATPGSWTTDACPVRGRVTALAGDNRWLYAAVLTSIGDTYIVAGREAFEGENGPIVWHPLAQLAGMECHAMHISGLWTNPRLFFGMGANVGYITLPRNGENPVQDTNSTYALSGSIYYPAHSWLAPTTPKVWKSIEIEGANLTSTRYVSVYYRIDGRGGWTLAGTARRTPRSLIPLGPSGVSGIYLEIRLDFTLPDSSHPLKVYSVVVRGAERPQTIRMITAHVRLADYQQQRGGRDRRTAEEVKADLEALAQSAEAVLLVDPLGHEQWVLVLAPILMTEAEQDGNSPPEWLATVQMAVFESEKDQAGEAPIAVYGTSRYDDGSVYA